MMSYFNQSHFREINMKLKYLLLTAATVQCTEGIFDKIANVYAQKELTHIEN